MAPPSTSGFPAVRGSAENGGRKRCPATSRPRPSGRGSRSFPGWCPPSVACSVPANTQLRTWLGTSAGLVLWTRSRMNACAKHIAVCRSRNRSGDGGYLSGRASDPLQLGLQVPCHRSLGSLARQRCSKTIQRRRGDSGDRRCRTFHDGRDHTGWRVALKGALTHVACAEGRDDFVGSQTSPGRERHKSDSA